MRSSAEVAVKVASKPDELAGIYSLRYRNYLGKGYISPNPSGMMHDEWDESTATIHFIALKEDTVIGAVRLVLDSPRGVPMERVFATEIGRLRAEGSKLAEASALVVGPDRDEHNREIWFDLCKAVWREAQVRGVYDLCIAVTQRHLSFYKRLLFEPLGPGKPYGSLNGVFAYPLRLKVTSATAKYRPPSSKPNASLQEHFLRFTRFSVF